MMTNKEIIEVVQAAEAGKKIQFTVNNELNYGWHNIDKAFWQFDRNTYRVKPEEKPTWLAHVHYIYSMGGHSFTGNETYILVERAVHMKNFLHYGWADGTKSAAYFVLGKGICDFVVFSERPE
jgi:hypothetical protein